MNISETPVSQRTVQPSLLIVALVAAVAAFIGGALSTLVAHKQEPGDNGCSPTVKQLECSSSDAAPYVLYIGNRSAAQRVMAKKGFAATVKSLKNATSVDLDSTAEKITNPPTVSASGSVTLAFVSVNQQTGQSQPCSQHVTQKIALNTPEDLQTVLDQLALK